MGGCLVCCSRPDSHPYRYIDTVCSSDDWAHSCNESCREVEINILCSLQTRQPPIKGEKYQCRIGTVSSPDDGHTVARNM